MARRVPPRRSGSRRRTLVPCRRAFVAWGQIGSGRSPRAHAGSGAWKRSLPLPGGMLPPGCRRRCERGSGLHARQAGGPSAGRGLRLPGRLRPHAVRRPGGRCHSPGDRGAVRQRSVAGSCASLARAHRLSARPPRGCNQVLAGARCGKESVLAVGGTAAGDGLPDRAYGSGEAAVRGRRQPAA